jgi:hypothetical protein
MQQETLREIEAQHPDIAFDWKVVRDNQQIVETAHEPRRRRAPRMDEGEAVTPPPPREVEAPSAPARPAIPARIEGDTPDAQIAFLTQLYPVIRERIPQRTPDPSRQEILLALAERMNPAAWTDADQITTGLQQAAEALERLSHVFGKRRRRGRKKTRGAPESAEGPTSAMAEGAADADATGEPDDSESADADENSSLE